MPLNDLEKPHETPPIDFCTNLRPASIKSKREITGAQQASLRALGALEDEADEQDEESSRPEQAAEL